jgi:hypothetical protein
MEGEKMSFPDNYTPDTVISVAQVVKVVKEIDAEMKKEAKENGYASPYYKGLNMAAYKLKDLFDSPNRAWFGIISGEHGDYDYRW